MTFKAHIYVCVYTNITITWLATENIVCPVFDNGAGLLLC